MLLIGLVLETTILIILVTLEQHVQLVLSVTNVLGLGGNMKRWGYKVQTEQ